MMEKSHTQSEGGEGGGDWDLGRGLWNWMLWTEIDTETAVDASRLGDSGSANPSRGPSPFQDSKFKRIRTDSPGLAQQGGGVGFSPRPSAMGRGQSPGRATAGIPVFSKELSDIPSLVSEESDAQVVEPPLPEIGEEEVERDKRDRQDEVVAAYQDKFQNLLFKRQSCELEERPMIDEQLHNLRDELNDTLAGIEDEEKLQRWHRTHTAVHTCGDANLWDALAPTAASAPANQSIPEIAEEEAEAEEGAGESEADAPLREPFFPVPAMPHGAVSQICASGQNCAALTSDGEVLVWGLSEEGEVGLGRRQFGARPMRVALEVGQGRRKHPRKAAVMAAGPSHMGAVTLQGEVLCWGSNMHGQLGRVTGGGGGGECGLVEVKVTEAAGRGRGGELEGLLLTDFRATTVACGQDWTVVVGNEEWEGGLQRQGAAYSFGRNDRGQCGQGGLSALSIVRRLVIPRGRRVLHVACGGFHSLALCEGGRVCAWGLNSEGQLGLGVSGGWVDAPAEVRTLEKTGVVQLAGGLMHSAAVLDAGELLTWGDGDMGQLGHGPSARGSGLAGWLPRSREQGYQAGGQLVGEGCNTPKRVRGMGHKCVAAVDCGDKHTMCSTVDGEAWAWGMLDDGRLGMHPPEIVIDDEDEIYGVLDERQELKRQQILARRAGGKIQWRPERVGPERAGQVEDVGAEGEGGGGPGWWFCAVACGEAHSLVLEATAPEEVREKALKEHEHRAKLLEGLALALRALRVLREGYEKPAQAAASVGLPVLESARRAEVLGESGQAIEFVRTLLRDVATAWGDGSPNFIVDRTLAKRLGGLSDLLAYLQQLPDRLAATLKVSSTIRFEEFLSSAQRRLSGRRGGRLLNHSWIVRKTGTESKKGRSSAAVQKEDTRGSLQKEGSRGAVKRSTSQGTVLSLGGIGRGGSLFRMWAEPDDEPREETLMEVLMAVSCIPRILVAALERLERVPEEQHGEVQVAVEGGSLKGAKDRLRLLRKVSKAMEAVQLKGAAEVRDGSEAQRGVAHALRKAGAWLWQGWVEWGGLEVFGDYGRAGMGGAGLVLGAGPVALFVALMFVPFYGGVGAAAVEAVAWVYVAMVLVLVLAVVQRAMRGEECLLHPRSRGGEVRDNASNRVALLVMVIQGLQLCALAFGEGIPYDAGGVALEDTEVRGTRGLNYVFTALLLDLRLHLHHQEDMAAGMTILIAVPLVWAVARVLSRRRVAQQGLGVWGGKGMGGAFGAAVWILTSVVTPCVTQGLFVPLLVRVAGSISCPYSGRRATAVMASSLHLLSDAGRSVGCTSLASPAALDPMPARYMHSRVLSDSFWGSGWTLGPGSKVYSLCGAVPCWEFRLGAGELVPQVGYALLGLLALGLYLPTAVLTKLPEQLPDINLDLHVAPLFRAESQLVICLLVFLREGLFTGGWAPLAGSFLGALGLFYRHAAVEPVGVVWVGKMQRMLYLWAAWASLASITSIALLAPSDPAEASPDSLPTLIVVVGWVLLLILYVAPNKWSLERMLLKNQSAEMVKDAGAAGEKDTDEELPPKEDVAATLNSYRWLVLRGRSGVAQRWWDIAEISEPTDEVVAPRIRKNASKTAQEVEVRRRRAQYPLMRCLRAAWACSARVFFPHRQQREATQRYDEVPDDIHADVDVDGDGDGDGEGIEPHWEGMEYLNLSYQHLGSKYQMPELAAILRKTCAHLTTLKLAANDLESFPSGLTFPLLEILDLSFNDFSSVHTLPEAPALRTLSLLQNKIPAKASALAKLKQYPVLKHLIVLHNPISNGDAITYYRIVAEACPALVTLDSDKFSPPPPEEQDKASKLPAWLTKALGRKKKDDDIFVPGSERTPSMFSVSFWKSYLLGGSAAVAMLGRAKRSGLDTREVRVEEMHPLVFLQQNAHGAREASWKLERGVAADDGSPGAAEREAFLAGHRRRRGASGRSVRAGSQEAEEAASLGWQQSEQDREAGGAEGDGAREPAREREPEEDDGAGVGG